MNFFYDENLPASTQSEWDNADASQLSWEHPNRAWVVTDRDVAHRNPYYKGNPVCHPECPCEGQGPLPGCVTNPAMPPVVKPTTPAAQEITSLLNSSDVNDWVDFFSPKKEERQ